jgi:transposase-like protein
MRFRTKGEIERRLSAQRTSGLSIAAYCKRENIHPNTFYQWRTRLSDGKPIPERSATTAVHFLRLPTPAVGTDGLALTLPNGAKLLVPPSYDLTALRQTIRMLAPLRPRR